MALHTLACRPVLSLSVVYCSVWIALPLSFLCGNRKMKVCLYVIRLKTSNRKSRVNAEKNSRLLRWNLYTLVRGRLAYFAKHKYHYNNYHLRNLWVIIMIYVLNRILLLFLLTHLILGKILDDAKTLKECNIEEKNFVVVMVSRVSVVLENWIFTLTSWHCGTRSFNRVFCNL